MTMSEKGDKICPLCTEEMDLTDQQLKPCKCGYEICIWCWHHIMGMAEKDATEGRCPACRTPYDKERIVGMASNRSVVAEIKVERKQKVQKAKPKASDVRKHLGSVRVFQRNLVHVIGLPLSIADEELLKRREYFGQYGKVLKTCISRTASGIIQHSSNDCFSLYITYSKEEEAVRCIQSVHSFMLEGRCLRACFGTTKYCNSWLKNVPCSNQHCLYLHEYGSEQDSFSKEEMVSAFARVQQTIGATHNMQLRSGDVLPPPADEYNNVTPSTVAKPVDRLMLKGMDKQKIYLPDANTGKYVGPAPAASCVPTWPLVSNSSGLTGPGKQKSDSSRDAMVLPSPVLSAKKLEPDVVIARSKKNEETLEGHSDSKPNLSESTLHFVGRNHHTPSSNIKTKVISTASPPVITPSNPSPSNSPPKQGGESIATSSTCTIPVEFTRERSSASRDKVDNTNIDGELQSLSSELSSISVHSSRLEDESSIPDVPVRVSFSVGATTTVNVDNDLKKEDSLALDGQGSKGSEGISLSASSPFSHELNESSNQSSWDSWKFDGVYIGNSINSVPQKIPIKPGFAAFPVASGNFVLDNNKGIDNSLNSLTEMDKMPECSDLFPDVRNGMPLGRYGSDIANSNNHGASDIDESHIISNILSMDGWEDGLTSSDNFAKLFAEADRQHGSHILRNAGKLQNANQSRFLFAQQEDLPLQAPDLEHFGRTPNHCFLRQDSVKNNSPPVENCQSAVSYNSFAGFDNARVCKPKVLTPPGFSASSKAPPPGFFSHEMMDLAAGKFSGGQGHFAASGNIASLVDAELNDPAILEIGKGLPTAGLDQTRLNTWHNLYTPPSPSDYKARLELLMQKPVDVHQDPKLVDYFSNKFSAQNNVYSAPTFLDYSQCGNLSPYAPLTIQNLRNDQLNGYWGGLNPVNSINNPAVSDFLSNENFGGHKLIPGYEDAIFRVPGTGNMYNRGFGF